MTWWAYVQTWCGQDNPTDIGRKIGIAGPTVHRWNRSEPKPDSVRAFADAYGRPVIEAFIAAGFLTPEQAAATVILQGVDSITDEQILAELGARLAAQREGAPHATQVQESQQGQGSASSGGEGGQPPKTQGSSERRPDPVKRSEEVQPTARGQEDITRAKALKAQSAEKTSK